MTSITYVIDGDNGNYSAIYIDGQLALDCETYELTPVEVISLLVRRGILRNVEVDERQIYFQDSAEFPPKLTDISEEQG